MFLPIISVTMTEVATGVCLGLVYALMFLLLAVKAFLNGLVLLEFRGQHRDSNVCLWEIGTLYTGFPFMLQICPKYGVASLVTSS